MELEYRLIAQEHSQIQHLSSRYGFMQATPVTLACTGSEGADLKCSLQRPKLSRSLLHHISSFSVS